MAVNKIGKTREIRQKVTKQLRERSSAFKDIHLGSYSREKRVKSAKGEVKNIFCDKFNFNILY